MASIKPGVIQERTKRDQLETFRAVLFQNLLSGMTTRRRHFHQPMLGIASQEELKRCFPGWTQPPTETNFGLELLHLENSLDATATYEEQKWTRENAHPEAEALPDGVIRQCSAKALNLWLSQLAHWIREDTLEAEKGPSSMLALVSANLSANRATLEYSALDNRGVEAAELTVNFLKALNAKGITEVPFEMEALAPGAALNVLKGILQGGGLPRRDIHRSRWVLQPPYDRFGYQYCGHLGFTGSKLLYSMPSGEQTIYSCHGSTRELE